MTGVFLVCVFAFVLSFLSLQNLAIRAGASPDAAWLMPLAMDVQTMVSTWAWLHPSLSQRVRDAARKITWIAIWLSILGNAVDHLITAIDSQQPGWMWVTSSLVGMVAPAGMAMTVHLASLIITDRIEATAKAAAATAKAAQKQAERATRATSSATPAVTGSGTVNGQVNGHAHGYATNGQPGGHPVPRPIPVANTPAPPQPVAPATPEPAATEAPVDKTAAIEALIAEHVAGGGDIHDRTQLVGAHLAAQVGATGSLGRRVLDRARKNAAQAATTTSSGKEVNT